MSPSSRNVEPRNCRAFADGQLIALRLKRAGQKSTNRSSKILLLLSLPPKHAFRHGIR